MENNRRLCTVRGKKYLWQFFMRFRVESITNCDINRSLQLAEKLELSVNLRWARPLQTFFHRNRNHDIDGGGEVVDVVERDQSCIGFSVDARDALIRFWHCH